jgi:LacI family transcriptional regulator
MPTIKDVALRSGVSTATVSHVVNGTRFVQPTTRDRVLASIRDLGYESDGIARSLRVRSTSLLALIIPDLSNPFFPEFAMAVQDAAVRSQYDVVMCSVDVPHGSSEELLQHHLRTIRRKRYDGVLFAEALAMKPAIRQQLMATGVPVVLIGGTPHPQADRVYIDDYAAARDVMDYLIRKGHSCIAHISGAEGMASTTERRRGYRDALRSAALPIDANLEVAGTFLRDGGYTAMQLLLAALPRPSAVFAANDLTAIGALSACLDAGLHVPGDVAIVGFDDIAIAADLRPALTTVYHGQREMGEEAVRLVLTRLRGQRDGPPITTIVPHRLVPRDSA